MTNVLLSLYHSCFTLDTIDGESRARDGVFSRIVASLKKYRRLGLRCTDTKNSRLSLQQCIDALDCQFDYVAHNIWRDYGRLADSTEYVLWPVINTMNYKRLKHLKIQ